MKVFYLVLFVVSLVLLPTAFAKPVQEDTESGDAKNIQGVWKVVSAKEGKKDIPAEEAQTMIFTITADSIAVKSAKDASGNPIGYRLDPTKNPKTIDIIRMKKSDAQEGPAWIPDQYMPGVYELSGDTLKLNYVRGGVPENKIEDVRPKSIDTADVKAFLIMMKR